MDSEKNSNQPEGSTKEQSLEESPCHEEHRMSMRCLGEVSGDLHGKCELEITNYKNCKEFWHTITLERRRARKTPIIPAVHERQAIFDENFTEFLRSKTNRRQFYHKIHNSNKNTNNNK